MQNNEPKTGNWFVDKLNLYQAANSDNESLKKNFVIRKAEFELIIEDLRRKNAKDPLQHELILGRRGSGKSTLLKRLQIEIEENADLSKKYIAINLAEEQAGIYRLSDLWFEVWQEISNQVNINQILHEFSTFENNQAYTRYLYSEIHKVLTEVQKKVVLLLDNFDRILENFNDDSHLLREILLNYNDLQLIGGSTRMDEHFWRYDKPFYEFFRRHRLESLSFEEIDLLLNHWSEAMNLPELFDYAPKHRGKIEAIRILTDGLPRTLHFFIQILLHDSTLYGFEYIYKMMDKATPLYQERLNSLTPPQRKIVLEIAFLWEACLTKQLVDKCRMEGKLISSFLKQLSSYGMVETISTQTKNHLYRLSERFFNMWLIITQGNPEQKRKAQWLTIFLETWYDAFELKNLAKNHLLKLKRGILEYDKAAVLTKALSQSKYVTTSQRDEMIDLTIALNKSKNDINLLLPEKFDTVWNEVIKLENEGKYQKALQKINEIENEEDGIKFFLKSTIYYRLKNYVEAEIFSLKAIEKKYKTSLINYNLGLIYDNQGKIEEAKNKYIIASKNGIIQAYNNLGNIFKKENNPQKAKIFYEIGNEKGDINALYNLALLYEAQGNIQESEKYYLHLSELGDSNSMFNLAMLYDKQGNIDSAQKYYLLAAEKGDIKALFNLAILNYEQGRFEETEKYYLLAIDKGNTISLFNLAVLYDEQGNKKEAEKYYLLAIKQGNMDAAYNLGILYESQGRNSEAEDYYLFAISNGVSNAWNNLSVLYFKQGRFNEAEKNYLTAIKHGNTRALFNLALLYVSQKEFNKAETYYQLAINNGVSEAFYNLALLYDTQGNLIDAEKNYLLAIKNGIDEALYNLAHFYEDQDQLKQAEHYYKLSIEKGIKDAILNLGLLYGNQGRIKEAEHYYTMGINQNIPEAYSNLAILYYHNNLHKEKSLNLVKKYDSKTRSHMSVKSLIIIEIWNGLFENLEKKINLYISEYSYKDLDWLIENLLYQEQKHLVLSLFENEHHGKELRERYALLYYATLLLTNKTENNLELRIPPEVQPTVQEIVETVKEKNAFYAQ